MKENNIDENVENLNENNTGYIPETNEEENKFKIVQNRKEVKKALILYKESAFFRLKRRIKMFFYDLKYR